MPELFEIVGRGILGISADDVQVFGITFEKFTLFDVNILQRGALAVDDVNGAITVNTDGLYDINFEFNVELNKAEQLDVLIYVNANPLVNNPVGVQGLGSGKPSVLLWNTTVNLVAGDVVDLWMRNGDPGTVSVNFINARFGITADS